MEPSFPSVVGFLGLGLLWAVFVWLIVGLIAGWLAGLVTRGKGYGCCADVLLGWVGAIIGGIVISALFNVKHTGGFIASIAIAFLGALILLLFARLIAKGATNS